MDATWRARGVARVDVERGEAKLNGFRHLHGPAGHGSRTLATSGHTPGRTGRACGRGDHLDSPMKQDRAALRPQEPRVSRRGRGSCFDAVLGRVAAALLAALMSAAPGAAQQPGIAPPATDAAADAATDLPRRVVLRFLTESDFPPFNFLDEDGALTGFNVDLARAICLELQASCDIKVRPWGELLVALKRGEADGVIAGHRISADLLKDVEFTDRYFHTPGRFATLRDRPQLPMTPEGLDGKRIAVARGTAHEAFLRAFFRDSAIQVFENVELARDALVGGKVDALFDDGVGLAFWLNGTLSKQCCEFRGGPFFEPKFFGEGIAIAVSRKDPQVRQLINGALKRVRQSGRVEELVQRYFPLKVY